MERTDIGTVISLQAGWNDLGNWEAVWEDSISDINKNTIIGNVFTKNVSNSYIRSESRLVVGIGLDDLLLIETEDALLIAKKNSINSLKDLVEELGKQNFKEIKMNRKIHRPWGHYVSLIEDKTWQVKRIEIKPNESLSLQMHKYRAEHWIVVNGTAKVEIDSKVTNLSKNQSIYIPLGSKHRLSNPSESILTVIEVQSGDYLGEDDIVRFDDIYGRLND